MLLPEKMWNNKLTEAGFDIVHIEKNKVGQNDDGQKDAAAQIGKQGQPDPRKPGPKVQLVETE